jgi:DNA-binding response OmpR family regulator
MAMILLLEDDADYADIVAHTLRRDGHEVVVTDTVDAAVQFTRRKSPQAAVLDVALPDGSGIDACRLLRELVPMLPVLFLSSMDRSSEIVSGLDAGGDDYLTKPFDPSELLARVRAVLRRSAVATASESRPAQRMTVQGLDVDMTNQTAVFSGNDLGLTHLELEILWQLLRYPGQALSHGFLTEQIWGYSNVKDATLLKGHVSSIRRKLRRAGGNDDVVRTVHGVGYSFIPL